MKWRITEHLFVEKIIPALLAVLLACLCVVFITLMIATVYQAIHG